MEKENFDRYRVESADVHTANVSPKMNAIGARIDWFLRLLVTLLVLVFPFATLFINHGDSYVFGLLVLIGVWVWLRDGARPWLSKDIAVLGSVFALFFVVALVSYQAGAQTDAGFRFLGRFLRFLFILPVYLAVRRYSPTAKTVFIGMALGALTAGIIASLEFLSTRHAIRVGLQTENAIIFGDLTSSIVLCMVAGFGLMAATRRRWTVLLLIVCLISGVVATLLSGTRGAWLPLFLLIPVLATPAAVRFKRRYLFIILMVFIAVFSSFYLITRTDTRGRLTLAYRNIKDYVIALHTVDYRDHKHAPHEKCINQAAFLQAWLKFEPTNRATGSRAQIVEDSMLKGAMLCTQQFAVRMANVSHDSYSRYIFPRVPNDDPAKSSVMVLVRGEGVFIRGPGPKEQIRFESYKYRTVRFNDGNHPDQLIIYIPPGKTVWLVPVEKYYGEYSLSIAATSVGKRFEMWRAAWHFFLMHPLLGIGTGAYQGNVDKLIQEGRMVPFIKNYDHPHNDYLDGLSSRGILGLLALLGILVIPGRRFLRATRSSERATHAIGLAGVLTVAGFAIYALTDTIFLHSLIITWYVIYMAVFYALLAEDRVKSRQEAGKPSV